MAQAWQVRLAGSNLGRLRHICAFFNGKNEYYRVLMPFIKEGFDQGDRACHILNQHDSADHRRRLRSADINVGEAELSGQLEIRRWEDVYLQDGHFDQDRQIALIETMLAKGKARRFPKTRLIANMEWALEDRPGVQQLVEYESRVNEIVAQYGDPICCTYDLSQFSASVVMDILRTHPMAVLGGILRENPFFVPPPEFLSELNERKQRDS